MTTNLDIIKRAMKKLHVLPSGQEPTSPQAADGMDLLQSLFVEMIGNGGLGRLADVVVPSTSGSYTAFGWSRVKYSTGTVVSLPTYTGDTYDPTNPPATYCHAFHDLAPIVLVDNAGTAAYWIFNAYSDGWTQVNGLTQQGTFPMAEHYVNGFSAMLADYICDDFAGTVGADTRRQAAWCRYQLANKSDSEDNVSPAPNVYY
jgi:hypothetical protein